jgi:8-oxo-dGTP diphosphatase
MAIEDSLSIDSVVVVPEYCHRCGAELGAHEFEGNELPWCPDCNTVFARNPVPGVHVVVHDADSALVLDEPIPQHEGVLSLPGGHARPDEGPKEAVVRELEEETTLHADPDDLRFVTVLHAELPEVAFYLLTYAVERSDVDGTLATEFEDGEAYFASLDALRANPQQIRDSDLDRIEQALEG